MKNEHQLIICSLRSSLAVSIVQLYLGINHGLENSPFSQPPERSSVGRQVKSVWRVRPSIRPASSHTCCSSPLGVSTLIQSVLRMLGRIGTPVAAFVVPGLMTAEVDRWTVALLVKSWRMRASRMYRLKEMSNHVQDYDLLSEYPEEFV